MTLGELQENSALVLGCIYSLDWTTGMDYWTGLLDSPLTPKILQIWLNLTLRLCQFVYYITNGLVLLANPSHFVTMV